MLSVIYDFSKHCPQEQSCQTKHISFSFRVVAVQQQIAQDQCGMIGHHHMVTAKQQDQRNGNHMDDHSCSRRDYICQSGTNCQNKKLKKQYRQSRTRLDSEIRKSEHHQAKKHHYTYNAVLTSEDPAVCGNKSDTEYNRKKNFEQIDRRMPKFIFYTFCILDQFFGSGLV